VENVSALTKPKNNSPSLNHKQGHSSKELFRLVSLEDTMIEEIYHLR